MKKLYIWLVVAILLLLTACSRGNNTVTPEKTETEKIDVSVPTEKDITPVGNDTIPTEKDNTPADEIPEPSDEDNLFTNEYSPVIISLKDSDGSFSKGHILGGSRDGNWYDINSFDIDASGSSDESETDDYIELDLVRGDETYKFYSENGLIAQSKGGRPQLQISPISEEKIITVSLEPLEAEGNFIIGVSGAWNAAPAISGILSEETPLRLDIDNDGEEETLSLVNNGIQSDAFGNEVEELVVNIINDGDIIFVCNILYNEIETAEYKVLPLDLDGNGTLEIVVVEYGIKTTVRIFNAQDDIADLVLISHIGE